jgi:hypothetical protein
VLDQSNSDRYNRPEVDKADFAGFVRVIEDPGSAWPVLQAPCPTVSPWLESLGRFAAVADTSLGATAALATQYSNLRCPAHLAWIEAEIFLELSD